MLVPCYVTLNQNLSRLFPFLRATRERLCSKSRGTNWVYGFPTEQSKCLFRTILSRTSCNLKKLKLAIFRQITSKPVLSPRILKYFMQKESSRTCLKDE